MWIISVLPEWVFHAIFSVGLLGTIAGFVLGFIPLINKYKLPIQVISLLVLSLGIYLEGGLADYKEWDAKVKELEKQVAVSEEKAKTKNVEIQEKIVTQTKIVKEKGKDIVQYIDRWNTKEIIKEVEGPERIRREEVIKYIENCPVPKEFIDLHNQATEMNKAAEIKK